MGLFNGIPKEIDNYINEKINELRDLHSSLENVNIEKELKKIKKEIQDQIKTKHKNNSIDYIKIIIDSMIINFDSQLFQKGVNELNNRISQRQQKERIITSPPSTSYNVNLPTGEELAKQVEEQYKKFGFKYDGKPRTPSQFTNNSEHKRRN